MRESGRHLSGGAQARGVEKLQLQILQAHVRSFALDHLRPQLVVRLRQLRGPLGDAVLERFGEMAQSRLRIPSLQRDGRGVGRDPEQKALRVGRKIRPSRSGNHDRIAVEPDRGGDNVHRSAAHGVGDHPGLLGSAEPGIVQGRSNFRFAVGWNSPFFVDVDGFDARLAPAGGQQGIDEVGTKHGKQGRGHAVADLTRAIIRPDGRQRRKRGQVTNAPAQVVRLGKCLDPWHGPALAWRQTQRKSDEFDTCGRLMARFLCCCLPAVEHPHGVVRTQFPL